MKSKLLLAACFCILHSAFCLRIAAQGTAFTYQGRLNDGAVPATGIYDLRFAIYDASSGPAQVGPALTNAATAVTNGLFTVTLDFGAGVFDGDERWLDIAVRTNGSGSFVALNPRQALTPAPYALFAPNAGAASTAGTAGSVAANGVASTSLQTGAVTSDKIADATIVQSDLAPALASNTFWRLNGNAGTTPDTNFIGTTDNQALVFRANNVTAFRLEPNVRQAPNVIGGAPVNYIAPDVVASTIAGGGAADYYSLELSNSIRSSFSTIGGGRENAVGSNSYGATIAGGIGNVIETNAYNSTVAGGLGNLIGSGSQSATIGGGILSVIGTNSSQSFIGGGEVNAIGANAGRSVIVGGTGNQILEYAGYAGILGGYHNTVGTNADNSVIGGGLQNTIGTDAQYATVPGGRANTAAGNYSLAAGYRAKALYNGDFVWADSQNADFASTAANQFLIRAAAGVGINKTNPATALDVNGTVTATAFSGSGASLSTLSGSSITSGTVGEARIDSSIARDSEILSTVLAGDGSGSGLDADRLDGLDATAFAVAAHNHYGSSWTGAVTKGLSVQTDGNTAGGAALHGQQGAGSGVLVSRTAGVWGDSSDGYGVVGSTRSTNSAGVSAFALATNGPAYGVYGLSYSSGGAGVAGYGLNAAPAFRALGNGIIRSSADSYVFVPGNALVKNLDTDTTRWDIQANGAARIRRGAVAGTKTVYFPIAAPAQLYGQPVTVESATVYYRCSNTTNSYISGTACSKQSDADSSLLIVSNVTARTNTVATSYTLTFSSNNQLTSEAGGLGFFLSLSFANDTDYVQIGGIRLRLSHE